MRVEFEDRETAARRVVQLIEEGITSFDAVMLQLRKEGFTRDTARDAAMYIFRM